MARRVRRRVSQPTTVSAIARTIRENGGKGRIALSKAMPAWVDGIIIHLLY